MTDKVQKIREEVERIKTNANKRGAISKHSIMVVCDEILSLIDSLQKEIASEDLKTELNKYIKDHFTFDTEQLDRFGIDEKDYMFSMDKSDMLALVEYFINWQKEKDESTTEDLGEYINELSKQFPEVSFAKLSRIAVRVAKWKEGQLKKNRLEHFDALTKEEAQREYDFVMGIIKNEHRIPTFDDAIKYGMRLQKGENDGKVIDAVICEVPDNDHSIYEHTHLELFVEPNTLEKNGFKSNDKVKVIVIKED